MKTNLAFFLYVLLHLSPLALLSQYQVRLVVEDESPIPQENIYITGSFNDWDSTSNPAYKLDRNTQNKSSINLQLPAGTYPYKYSGGNWRTVEKGINNDEIPDRYLRIQSDTIIHDTVYQWRNKIPDTYRLYLASAREDTTRLIMALNLAGLFTYNSDYFHFDSSSAYLSIAQILFERIKVDEQMQLWPGYEQQTIIRSLG